MTARNPLTVLRDEVTRCVACPRLVAWRTRVSVERRKAYRDEVYYGLPVPGWGDPKATVVVVGLAPGAHGANRTGRMFTGDGSGDFLYPALYRAGLASQPGATSATDGMRLKNCWITAAARCAPPDNHPTPTELATCAPFLQREIVLLSSARVFLCLGAIAWKAMLGVSARLGWDARGIAFGHGVEVPVGDGRSLLASYHVSRQNTQTGRLTLAMFDTVVARALVLARNG